MKKQVSLLMALCLLLSLLVGCAAPAATDANTPAQSSDTQVEQTTDAATLVRDIPTVQYFTKEAVSEEDIALILEAGVQAPSAMNQQPWHFTAVTDAEVLQQIAGGMGGGIPAGAMPMDGQMPEGMELPEGAEMPEMPEMPEGMSAPPAGGGGASSAPNKAGMADAPLAIIISAKAGSEFDAGLACQNMSVEAQLLGYGTKIISSPTMALNGEKQAEYKELLGIPEDMAAVAVLLVGHADEATAAANGADAVSSATAREPMDTVVTYVTAE